MLDVLITYCSTLVDSKLYLPFMLGRGKTQRREELTVGDWKLKGEDEGKLCDSKQSL